MTEKIFRDAVHGDIALDPRYDVVLLDTPEMQRLRGIKQLGTANLVYPCALHTRFDHSLGTCWLARRMVEAMEHVQGVTLEDEEKRIVKMAALLHDVSHIPYGHTFEDERRIFDRHDVPDRIARFLTHGTLGKKLQATGLRRSVIEVLTDKYAIPVLSQIVSGTICADLLDYLARDSYFCGLTQNYDTRIFRYFRVQDGLLYLDAQKEGVIREDVISEIINLLRLRYFLSERVYFHHSKTASGAMISRAVETAKNHGLQLEDMFPLKDESLLMMLGSRFGDAPGMDRLLEAFEARSIYKRCYVLTRSVGDARQDELIARYHFNAAQREEAESHLIRKTRLRPAELIVYCPSKKMMLKEANVPVRVDAGPPRMLSSLGIPEVDVLLDKHRSLWKFYVFVARERQDRLKAISAACEDYFCEVNHLPALQSGQMYLK